MSEAKKRKAYKDLGEELIRESNCGTFHTIVKDDDDDGPDSWIFYGISSGKDSSGEYLLDIIQVTDSGMRTRMMFCESVTKSLAKMIASLIE